MALRSLNATKSYSVLAALLLILGPSLSSAQSAAGEITMLEPSYAGSGCPQGTAAASLSPDGSALSVIFDNFVVEAGEGTRSKKARKDCEVRIPIQVPPGYALESVTTDYRGFVDLPSGTRADLYTGVRYLEVGGHKFKSRFSGRTETFKGEKREDFFVTTTINAKTLACGQSLVLGAASSLQVKTNKAREHVLATIDTLDGTTHSVNYGLRWVKCDPRRTLPRSPRNP